MKRAFCLLMANVAAIGAAVYTYDAARRLTKADYGNGSVIVYGYDAAGNLTTRTQPGSLSIAPATLPQATYGSAFSQQLTVTGGGNNPFTWSLTTGTLPTGITLSTTGLLSGIPVVALSTSNFTVKATSTGGSATMSYSMFINPPTTGSLTVTPPTLPAGAVRTPYSQTLTETGSAFGNPVSWSVTAGALPPGLNLAGASGTAVISGTPGTTAPFFTGEASLGNNVYYLQFPGASYPFTVTASSTGGSGTIAYNLAVNNGNLFGYYNRSTFPIFYHYDLGFLSFVDGGNGDTFLYDFTSKHWWYTNAGQFPYIYDFTLKTWVFYFPDTKNPGHYTTNPRYFSNLTTGQIFTM